MGLNERVTPHSASKLAEEIHIAAERKMWDDIVRNLHAKAPNEACAFVLTVPSRGVKRATVIMRRVLWPTSGEVQATPFSLEISADYISRVMDEAVDAGPLVGVCLIHTHPASDRGPGKGSFSPRDDWYEKRLFPTLTLGRKEAIAASLVLGSEGDVDGRIWWEGTEGVEMQRAHAVRIVGSRLEIIETPSSAWTDHTDPKVMDRSTRLWGKEGRRRLQNLRVGIPGAGGTGSLSLFALATMGVGKLEVWDKDIATKENRHRTAGVTASRVGIPKVRALEALAHEVRTAAPFEIEVHEDWATTEEGLRQLKDCDILFCCVDRFAPRVALNDLAYAHLIPTLDMASWLHRNDRKEVDALMTHAQVWSPGMPCAWCRGTLSSYKLMREAQGRQQAIEKRIPYGLPLEETEGAEPSVLPLNMLGVSLALMEFMQVALGITTRTPRDLKFTLPEWELDENDLVTNIGCDCESNIAAGDTLAIRPILLV